ncbi:MAG: type I methionyl aminopeptidase [Candidatus Pacebacteria bacterium]|nr:type I methionyl aminopeptidase [Candidatus Paceibacterota bacterium]
MIAIKTEQEIEIMRQAGRILAEIIEKIKPMVAPGITGKELDGACEALILQYGSQPAFKDYGGFPCVSCISINDMVVHGVPNDQVLKQGDLLCLDLGIKYKDYFSDYAFSTLVGSPKPEDSEKIRLIKTTQKALKLAIAKAKPGNTFGDIGNVIQRFVEYQGFNVVRDLCGHGIGKTLHEDPKICNYGKRGTGEKIVEGMVFCIEPMVTMGNWKLKQANDGFGYRTADGSLACHFEHTVAVLKNGAQVLTKI